MKKVLLFSILVIVAFSLIFGSCAQTSSSSSSSSPAAPSAAEPIKLRLTHPSPPVTVFHKEVFVPWVETIEERTAAIGKPVEITIFPAQTLVKHADQYNAVVKGVTDISGMITVEDFEPGGGLLSAIELPFLFPSAVVAAQVAQELYDTIPAVKDETSKAKLIFFHPTGIAQLHSRNKQIKDIGDLEGLKVKASRHTAIDFVKTFGGIPVDMMIPEVYVALDRGVLDVFALAWEACNAFKLYEVTKYRTEFPQGVWLDLLALTMNWDSYNSLPPDVQEIFDEESGQKWSKIAGEAFDNADLEYRTKILELAKAAGQPDVYKVEGDAVQIWKEAANPVYDMWLERVNSKGLPGETTLEAVRRLTEKYSQ